MEPYASWPVACMVRASTGLGVNPIECSGPGLVASSLRRKLLHVANKDQLLDGMEYPHLTDFTVEHILQPGYDYGDEFGSRARNDPRRPREDARSGLNA